MSLTKDSPSTGSLDVIGRLSDHNREELDERLKGASRFQRIVRTVGPPIVVFGVFIGIWYLFRAFFLNDSSSNWVNDRYCPGSTSWGTSAG